MEMSFKLVLYCISFVIITPIILGTHANNDQIHKPRMLNKSAQAKSTQEHLEEAFEEQVRDWFISSFLCKIIYVYLILWHSKRDFVASVPVCWNTCAGVSLWS